METSSHFMVEGVATQVREGNLVRQRMLVR
jgi:hypothetical protein